MIPRFVGKWRNERIGARTRRECIAPYILVTFIIGVCWSASFKVLSMIDW